jgi:tRNA:m4X modification enzyme
MIYEFNLKSHVAKCPKTKVGRDERDKIYYIKDVNGGGSGSHQFGTIGNVDYQDQLQLQLQQQLDPKKFAVRVLRAFRNTFFVPNATSSSSTTATTTVTTTSPNTCWSDDDTRICNMTLEEIYSAIPSENLFAIEDKVRLEEMIQLHRIKIGGNKHLEQIGSFLGHARKHELLSKTKTVLEMGAGRATTGFVISCVCSAHTHENVRLILVERGGSRSKADAAFRRINNNGLNINNNPTLVMGGVDGFKTGDSHGNETSTTASTVATVREQNQNDFFRPESVTLHRIKCDLAHVSLSNVFSEVDKNTQQTCHDKSDRSIKDDNTHHALRTTNRDVLVIAKHLCGAGTDLALKSVYPIRDRICGCILATCCHGVCAWEHYVGRDYLASAMGCLNTLNNENEGEIFGETEFNVMKKWATGTVITEKNSQSTSSNMDTASQNNEDNHNGNLNEVEDSQQYMSVTKVASSLGLQCGPQGLGRACQRLIDYGRCEYIRCNLFQQDENCVSMLHYVEPHVTPQNAMILGLPDRKK